MSSLRNAIPRRAHKERAQPHSRRKFGLLEKHKDYVERARAYHQKEQALQEPDEFYFKMIKTKNCSWRPQMESEANKYTTEELMLMKTQDIGYILQKLQTEKKKIEKLSGMLHCLDNHSSSKHVYYADDRFQKTEETLLLKTLPKDIKRKTAASYRELEARKSRVKELEKIYMDMAMQQELQKKGRKRKLREDEIVCPTSRPVYKWRQERKR
ncbi:hypothetical protein Pfo_028296 [Paulownia fortunei]|nr:hypothetical protein Pfo_028296 [Paulownia fortunei]